MPNNEVVVKLIHSQYGEPVQVLKQVTEHIPEPELNEVLLQMLAAPVNPVDINFIQGKYLKASLPSVPGYEGVARVIKLGPGIKKLQAGDHVIPLQLCGTWRTHLTISEELLQQVPTDLGLVDAATLSINPPTVYRLLRDFVDLQPGDTVIQNGANSACGVITIQMCKYWGYNTVNIVRNRPDIANLKAFLKSLGATYVFTEEEIKTTDIFKTGTLQSPALALNCVGGSSASSLIKHLDFGGTMVTYGGMSMQPVTVPTSALVFKDISLKGFAIRNFMTDEKNVAERGKMFEELFSMIQNGHLKAPPHVLVQFDDYRDAIDNTLKAGGMVGKKYILDFTKVVSKF